MKTSDFNFELPQELIAQTPIPRRDASRLLVLDKDTGAWEHRHFYDLPDYLRPGDCLILNNSRVLPARLLGHRLPGGGACEILLLIDRGENTWECLVRPGKKLRTGARVSFGDGQLTAEITEELPGGNRLVHFEYEGIFLEVLDRLGKMPLPPYIKEELLIVLGTSSSESVLPRMMTKMELAGVSRSVVGLVIPTGYSFNLDGTAIYLTMAAVFIAQACDVSMTLTQQLTLLAVLLLTSKGAAGVTGSGFIVLAATLSAVGHVPVAGLALILGIDRFMSEARALTNMIGNGIACVVVGHWCREVDNDKLKVMMHSKKKYHENEDAS